MKHFTRILTAILLTFSSGFTVFSQQTNHTITVGSTTRSYIRYLPSGLNTATETPSVLFVLHGLGGTNTDMTAAGFSMIADTSRTIAIYPQGVPNSWGQNSWNNGTLLSSDTDDIGFFNQVLDELLLNYNVDPTRVYFTGFSMGSIMSYHVACAMNNRVAAIGCMAGTMSTSDIETCNPAYATPVIHLHGTADGTVPYNSNPLPSLSLVPETMAFWQNVHDCDASTDSLRYPDLANDGITVDRFRYDNCDPAGSVELWRFNGADHIYLYQPVNDITEMLEVWNFLNKWSHPSPTTLGTGTSDLTAMKLQIAPNPSAGMFKVTAAAVGEVIVCDVNGREIRKVALVSGENQVDLSAEVAGVYFMRAGTLVYRMVKV